MTQLHALFLLGFILGVVYTNLWWVTLKLNWEGLWLTSIIGTGIPLLGFFIYILTTAIGDI